MNEKEETLLRINPKVLVVHLLDTNSLFGVFFSLDKALATAKEYIFIHPETVSDAEVSACISVEECKIQF